MVEDGTWDAKGEILKPEGKIEDENNPGVFSQIILILNPEWQIQFYPASGYTRIFGGKIVGGVNGEPMLATGTAGDITVLESPVDGVTVEVGSGVIAQDIVDIKDAIFDEPMNDSQDFRANIDDMGAENDLMLTYMNLKIGDYINIDIPNDLITSELGTFSITISEPSAGVKRFTRTA